MLCVALLCAVVFALPANAAVLYWGGNGTTETAFDGAFWHTGTTNWTTDVAPYATLPGLGNTLRLGTGASGKNVVFSSGATINVVALAMAGVSGNDDRLELSSGVITLLSNTGVAGSATMGSAAGATGTLTISGGFLNGPPATTGFVGIAGKIYIGSLGTGTLIMTSGSFGAGELLISGPNGKLTISGGVASINYFSAPAYPACRINLAAASGKFAEVNLSGTGILESQTLVSGLGTTVINISGSAQLILDGTNEDYNQALLLPDPATAGGDATLNMTGGTVDLVGSNFFLSKPDGSTSTLKITGTTAKFLNIANFFMGAEDNATGGTSTLDVTINNGQVAPLTADYAQISSVGTHQVTATFTGTTPFGQEIPVISTGATVVGASNLVAIGAGAGTDWFLTSHDNKVFVKRDNSHLLGDFNNDGIVSGLDIPGFKTCLANPAAWESATGRDAEEIGDYTGDGFVTGLDIAGFKADLAS